MDKAKEMIEKIPKDLPNNAMGYPDLCSIDNPELKKEVFDFIDEVNAKGGVLPIPHCKGN